MSRQASLGQNETATSASADGLAVIREQTSPEASSIDLLVDLPAAAAAAPINPCICKLPSVALKGEDATVAPEVDAAKIEELLKAREEELRAEFEEQMEKEISKLKEKFDFILHNEQVRASVMLREAHRERREKIGALQTQLECKNMSGLMYVMCAERRKCSFEKMALTQEYTAYIRALQSILVEAQALILDLSRGYKTAGRVDREWRTKMQKVIREFQNFVVHYMGNDKEACQYLFDMPKLLSTEAPVEDNALEDPCTCEEEEDKESAADEEFEEPAWWHALDRDCRPFVMFGDCADLKPTQRRQLLLKLNTAEEKTAPKKWKEYKFNEMFVNADCSNVEAIKEEYHNLLPLPPKWECQANQTPDHFFIGLDDVQSRRHTTTSVDLRGNMGSILKIMTSSTNYMPQPAKTTLLAARDSMEIASSTKILHSVHGGSSHPTRSDAAEVKLDIKKRRQSMLAEEEQEEEAIFEEGYQEDKLTSLKTNDKAEGLEEEDEEDDKHQAADLASIVNDSLDLVHKPCADAKINFEKVCPMEKCQRMKVDSFLHSLPPYMRASPYMHFEQSYADYETCTPEQLDLLMKRVIDKKQKETPHAEVVDPLDEWAGDNGVGTQTSWGSSLDLPCTCRGPSPTPVSTSSDGKVYDMSELVPIKQMVNLVGQTCFYEEDIEFNRFKLLGQDSRQRIVTDPPKVFMQNRIDEIKKILKRNPSLLDMFQANTQC